VIDTAALAGRRDVMQVCRNGHVVTDLLCHFPERGLAHCDRCGAQTLDRCLTCGQEIPGGVYIPGLPVLGSISPPNYCACCGAAFPWAARRCPPPVYIDARIESLLRRLPAVIRQLRWRQTERAPFQVQDGRDLEDLLRALLVLHVDDIRPEIRTPHYTTGKQSDLLLSSGSIAITAKFMCSTLREPEIREQLQEDAAYYQRLTVCKTLVLFVYDSGAMVHDPAALERACADPDGRPQIRCIVAGF
jgi:hypothetical protein